MAGKRMHCKICSYPARLCRSRFQWVDLFPALLCFFPYRCGSCLKRYYRLTLPGWLTKLFGRSAADSEEQREK